MDDLARPAIRSILEQGRHLYVAVAASAGPHVTPELYSAAGGRLWFWAAHDTVKAAVLADDDRVGAVVPSAGGSVVLTGRVRRFDVRDLATLPAAIRDPWALGRATLRFGLRNAADLGAFATDLVTGRLGRSLPPRRVLFGIRPTRIAVIDHGTVLLATGDWEDPSPATATPVAQGRRAAVVAWETASGPIALPGRVDLPEGRAWLAPALVALAGLPSPARAAVVVDDYVAPGPAAKEGTLLRGTATLAPDASASFTVARATDWDGVRTRTRRPA